MIKLSSLILYFSALLIALPASAEICLPGDQTGNTCTAKDFTLSEQLVSGPSSCNAGELIPSLTLRVGMEPTAKERFDIGIFIGDQGQSPIGGASCTFTSLSPLEPVFDGGSGSGPYRNLDDNSCGDTLKSDGVIFKNIVLQNVLCQDSDGDGNLDIAYAITWRSKSEQCDNPNDPNNFIETPLNKCINWVGDVDEVIVIPPPPTIPSIEVTKLATPNIIISGETVSYTVSVLNNGVVSVNLTTLLDDKFGDLNGQGSCATPKAINAGNTYSCSFTESVSGAPGSTHINTVTASATDGTTPATNDDQARVTILAIADGGIGQYVWNDLNADGFWQPGERGINGVTIDLKDDTGNVIQSTTTSLLGEYEFESLVVGDYQVVITDTAGKLNSMILTAGVEPHSLSLTPGEKYTQANFGYAKAEIQLVKTASVTVISAPGDNITYSVAVNNTGTVDVRLTELTDDMFGNLNGLGTCSNTQTILAGASYNCEFTQLINGNAGDSHTNTITAVAGDFNGHNLFAADTETVRIIAADNGSIGDRVWNDGNRNGIHDIGEAGINGVTLQLRRDSNDDGNYDLSLGTQTTVNSGAYDFIDLPAGHYQVLVIDIDQQLLGLELTGGIEPLEISLGVGQNFDTADFGYASLLLPSISVSKVASPLLINAPGADVDYAISVMNTGATDVLLESLIDDRFGDLNGQGDCSVPQNILLGDIYQCSFTTFVSGPPRSFHINAASASARDKNDNIAYATNRALVFIAKDESGVIGSIGDLVWNDFNADGVVDPDEPGLANVTLDLLQNGSVIDSTITNSQGLYRFNNLPVGSYQVKVTDTRGVLKEAALSGGTDPHIVALSTNQTYRVADFGYHNRVAINVSKTAQPNIVSSGGLVSYTVSVSNSGLAIVELSSLLDDKFGDLNGQGSCAVPQTLSPANTYSCSFTQIISGAARSTHLNTVTASATDGTVLVDDNDSALVIITDPKDVGIGQFIWNDLNADGFWQAGEPGIDGVTIDLKNATGKVIQTTTSVLKGEYEFDGLAAGSYQVVVSDSTGKLEGMILTAGVEPHDLTLNIGQEYMQANFGYAKAAIRVVKLADPSVIKAPGQSINYTITVTNTGPIDITLTELKDDKFGNLNGKGTCRAPQSITVGANYGCHFTQTIQGNPGDTHNNIVAAVAENSAGDTLTAANAETVWIIADNKASVGDRVWNDSNRNGLQDTHEPGINDVTLLLKYDSNNDGTYDLAVGDETTINSGEYNFINLPAGNYQVQVTDVKNRLQGWVLTSGVEPHELTLANAQDYDIADFGYAQPPKPAIKIDKTASPIVVNVPGADVNYTITVSNIGETDVLLESLTDDRFGDLNGQGSCSVPQTIFVGAQYNCSFIGFASGSAGSFHINTAGAIAKDTNDQYAYDSNQASVFIAKDESNVMGSISDLVWSDLNADGMIDPNEPGISNITLDLLQNGSVIASTITDTNGLYLFNHLPVGSYQVKVTDQQNILIETTLTGGTNPHNVALSTNEMYLDADFGYHRPLVLTPAIIPTLSSWILLLMSSLLAVLALVHINRKRIVRI